MNRHLNEEEVLGWVSGERSQSSAEHVNECAECRNELERLSAAISGFRVSTLDWAEQARQDAPARAGARGRMSGWCWFNWQRLQWAVAPAVLLVFFGVVMTRHYVDKPKIAVATSAADDAVLERVNAAMSREVPSAMEPLSQLMPTERQQKAGESN
jgi:hypothetical protein